MIVREAALDDATAIADVLALAFEEYRPDYTAAAYEATTSSASDVRLRLREGPIWLAIDGVRAVGTVSAKRTLEGIYLRGMAILPDARGLGIGVALLDCVVEYARRESASRLYLSTTPFLLRAIRLYERYGFRRIEGGPPDLHGTPLFTMEKVLASGSSAPPARP